VTPPPPAESATASRSELRQITLAGGRRRKLYPWTNVTGRLSCVAALRWAYRVDGRAGERDA